MSDEFRFETFVDAHSNIFREYLSSVIAKLSESNEDYRAIQEQMEAIFQQYPKVLEAVDTETAEELSQQECAALIKVMELRNNLTDIEMQTVYFRGCYDGVGLASEAPVILADEPTGNLDEDTAQDITEILKESAHKMNKCVVVVTHSNELAKQADVVFRLKKGELQVLERVQDGAAQPQSRRNNAPRSERRAH